MTEERDKICAYLYQGSMPEDWNEVWRTFDLVVSLDYVPEAAVGEGKVHLTWHIDDGEAPEDREMLWGLVKLIAESVRRGKRTLVHCGAGLNRSGLVCALIYRELTGCSGIEAVDQVRRCRKLSLFNTRFVSFIDALDRVAVENEAAP